MGEFEQLSKFFVGSRKPPARNLRDVSILFSIFTSFEQKQAKTAGAHVVKEPRLPAESFRCFPLNSPLFAINRRDSRLSPFQTVIVNLRTVPFLVVIETSKSRAAMDALSSHAAVNRVPGVVEIAVQIQAAFFQISCNASRFCDFHGASRQVPSPLKYPAQYIYRNVRFELSAAPFRREDTTKKPSTLLPAYSLPPGRRPAPAITSGTRPFGRRA